MEGLAVIEKIHALDCFPDNSCRGTVIKHEFQSVQEQLESFPDKLEYIFHVQYIYLPGWLALLSKKTHRLRLIQSLYKITCKGFEFF